MSLNPFVIQVVSFDIENRKQELQQERLNPFVIQVVSFPLNLPPELRGQELTVSIPS